MHLTEYPIQDPVAEAVVADILAAADPAGLLRESLHVEHERITAGPYELSLPSDGRLMLIAIGKAAAGMTRAALEIFGNRIQKGLVTLQREGEYSPPDPLQTFVGGHPLPTEGSLAAGAYAADMLVDTKPEDRLFVLVSGGGSAMFECLPPDISLEEVVQLTEVLIHSGMPIQHINVIRQSLSLVKGGGLAQLASPALTIGLILSDIIGDPLPMIASGPSVWPINRSISPQRLLQEHKLWEPLSAQVKDYLNTAASLTPPIFQPVNVLIGGNDVVVSSAQAALESCGFSPRILSMAMQGEARDIGRDFARQLQQIKPNEALIMGGETTVSVTGSGRGGRNQELALAAALELEGGPTRKLMAIATDGIDGNSEAAGALVDQSTAEAIRNAGLDPAALLVANDSNTALASANALITTGVTGTNLNDLVIGWHSKDHDG